MNKPVPRFFRSFESTGNPHVVAPGIPATGINRMPDNAVAEIFALMKFLALHGSPRTIQSQTSRLAGFVLEGAAGAGAQTEMIDLADFRITPCIACGSCALTETCVYDDDVAGILSRMREANGIVLGSPVYVDNVTGQMKVFVDRLADAIHYQVLTGKFGCAVAATHESGGDAVIAYLNHVLNYLGIISVGGISIATRGDPGVIDTAGPEAHELGTKLVGAIRNGYSYPVQEGILEDNRAYFKMIVEENREFRASEYDRWVQRGWIR
jgi:multimeric flavodoxin WrbA